MTYQEILEAITRHRANPLDLQVSMPWNKVGDEFNRRKLAEIEWALQALAEKLASGDKE